MAADGPRDRKPFAGPFYRGLFHRFMVALRWPVPGSFGPVQPLRESHFRNSTSLAVQRDPR